MAKLLVLEDDPDMASMLQEVLLKAGHDVSYCYNATRAFWHLERTRFDLLILDLLIREKGRYSAIGGGSVLQRVRLGGLATPSDVPALVITGAKDEAIRGIGSLTGADATMQKPFGVGELVEKISELINMKSMKLAN